VGDFKDVLLKDMFSESKLGVNYKALERGEELIRKNASLTS
jgi:hypothetical protein